MGNVPNSEADGITVWIERLLGEMIDQQATKVLQLARALDPRITPEDARNPHDFEVLARDASFQYEDGILAGLESARIAIRAELRELDSASRSVESLQLKIEGQKSPS